MRKERLRELFIEEAQEHLKGIESVISGSLPGEKELAEAYRHAHSLKGMCATVGLSRTVEKIHRLEEYFSSISAFEKGREEISRIYGEIKRMIERYIESGVELEEKEEKEGKKEGLVPVIKETSSGEGTFKVDIFLSSSLPMPSATIFKLIRNIGRELEIYRSNADKNLLKKGEYPNPLSLIVKGNVGKLYNLLEGEKGIIGVNVSPVESPEQKPLLGETLRVRIDDLDRLMDDLTQFFLLKEKIKRKLDPDDDLSFKLDMLVEKMYDRLLDIRMVPLKILEDGLKEMVQSYSKELGKRVILTIVDKGVLIDRGVVDKLYSILVHIIKNAVYHGIETPEERREMGKSPAGIVKIEAEDFPDAFQIRVSDDGRGVDIERVREKIVEMGLVEKEKIADLSESEILQYLFHPGMSTSENKDVIAGRGVGLDAVKEMVQKLYGFIYVESERGKGTVFTIKIPRSAILQNVVIVMMNGERVAFPSYMVEALVSVDDPDNVRFRGEKIEVKGVPSGTALIFGFRGKYLGYFIEEVEEIDMVLVRELPSDFRSVPYLYGYFFRNGEPSFLIHPGILWSYFPEDLSQYTSLRK